MKKLAAVLILAAAITMTGCQGSKQEEKPAASKTEEVNQASDELKEKLGDGYILPSEAVTKVLAKKWDVVGTESVYDLKEDGTGTLDGKALTFECGFDEGSESCASPASLWGDLPRGCGSAWDSIARCCFPPPTTQAPPF